MNCWRITWALLAATQALDCISEAIDRPDSAFFGWMPNEVFVAFSIGASLCFMAMTVMAWRGRFE